MADNDQKVFISYAWGEDTNKHDAIVSQIDKSLQKRGLKIIRDKRDLGYKGSIRKFMERIGEGDSIIVVISDKYLRSENCMYEFVQIAKNKHLADRIFPIILSDAKIYDASDRLDYVEHWEKEKARLNKKIRELTDFSNLQSIQEELNDYDEFRDEIDELPSTLKDMNTLYPAMHEDMDFSNLYASILEVQKILIPQKNEQAVFISYAWGEETSEREAIVNQIDKSLQKRGLKIVRDKRDLGYKGSIRKFMERIGEGDSIIIVISDKYLRSKNCMYELVQISKNKQFADRVFPIILSDAKIFDAGDRVDYIEHWEKEKERLNKKIRELADFSNLQSIQEELNDYDDFRDEIDGLAGLLKNMNTLSPNMHKDSDFSELFTAIEKRMKELGAKLGPAANHASLGSTSQTLEEKITKREPPKGTTYNRVKPVVNKRIQKGTKAKNNKIFIVHGHDNYMKEVVARTIEKLELNAIILHEKPNQGKTIMEKFIEFSDVNFAIVLLTPDDVAYSKKNTSGKKKFRARQNVIFELGFFIGKLGRERVVSLYRHTDNFDIPSDYSGVIFIPFDESNHWKHEVVKELVVAGYEFDIKNWAKL